MRVDGRQSTELRPVQFQTGFLEHHRGSVLVSFGRTRVLVTATHEERVPPHRVSSGGGWLTAEYAMLPASTHERRRRDISTGRPDGRSVEIQRLIGRALRNVVRLDDLGPITLHVDCDVLQADGGTRTAAITGAWVALRLCLEDLRARKLLKCPVEKVLTAQVAAVSLGLVKGEVFTDLCYEEDARADTDLNLVARQDGLLIEVQGTAEGDAMSRAQLDRLVDQGMEAIAALCRLQQAAIAQALHG
ncbi:MAG: ribonuclease PH [Myxococcota bacterium]